MKFNVAAVRECLKSFDFATLFREHLGWDNHNQRLDVPIEDTTYELAAVAEKRGFVAFICPVIPDRATRLKIDYLLTKSVREHFVIYTDQNAGEQVWHWVRREPGKPLASRDHRFHINQSGDPLIQRLDQIAISLDEEEQITVVDVASRARAAFDVDRLTKRFYDRFKTEHADFLKLIKGIKSNADLQWYTSLMLNRLMFVYFIQKKGFLDGDTDYLRNRLQKVKEIRGKDKFHSFYRYFLLRLFHEGLGKSPEERRLDPTFERLLGRVPFLNGGFFEVHELEARWTKIDIPDAAFEKLFSFFDQYAWHLDERPLRADNEINPDVVGYIFEKYVNQKQMGAYYTKEDITEYISKNTIIPFLFDAARKKCAIAFKPDSALWRLLRDDPDRYIYPAVRHGVVRADGLVVPESELPDFVQQGMHDPKARMFDKRYNLEQAPKGDPFRLVTETWREYVYRRNRCLEIREKLQKGEVHEINDLITLNLDIWQFARDAITGCEGPELLRAFWHAIKNVSVLDPTCGSGAFLFAALRILETLYSDCMERMERFIEDIQGKKHHPEQFSDFRKVLEQIAKHPSERYFILKSIIINNLYGVDIMEEAVEICKLRLFLKLVAQVETVEQIEPLPDIDFNIRTGNTLVGFASLEEVRKTHRVKLAFGAGYVRGIEEEAETVKRAYDQFRDQQTEYGGRVTHKDKEALRERLRNLTDRLDRFLASEYSVSIDKPKEFEAWKVSHQPFHWFAEFYGIMSNGGFDVIIGNPPYLEQRQVGYVPKGFACFESGAIHAMCVERSANLLLCGQGSMSMIVPLALPSTQRMKVVRDILEKDNSVWYANFSWRPGKLFDTVNRALTIFIVASSNKKHMFSTAYQKWSSDNRFGLFERVLYIEAPILSHAFWVPKLGALVERSILEKCLNVKTLLNRFMGKRQYRVYYRTTGGLYWKVFTDFAPTFKVNGKPGHSTRETWFTLFDKSTVQPIIAALSSDIFWWWYTITSNCRDLNPYDIGHFPLPETVVTDPKMAMLGRKYIDDLVGNSTLLLRHQKQTGKTETQCFKIQKSKPIIDEIDRILAQHYGFTDEELDFIINYDIKYRMGGDAGEDEE